jgi:hypothetical protein
MAAFGSVLAAGYRADGLRAWKQNSSGTTYYLYDGDELVEEVNSSGSPISKMTWGPTGLLARATSTRTLLYTTDALGQLARQVRAFTTSIVANYMCEAWGGRQVSTSDPTAASDPFGGYNARAGYSASWRARPSYFHPRSLRNAASSWSAINSCVLTLGCQSEPRPFFGSCVPKSITRIRASPSEVRSRLIFAM